ncbi:MAG: hypothetical protein JEZ04_18280 [Spirochaetales bacterium]|nr:hypothetical protein [Spirochaetales bacterium]
MTYKAEKIYRECLKQFIGGGGIEGLGGTSLSEADKGSLSSKIQGVFDAIIQGTNPETILPGKEPVGYFYNKIKSSFTDYYSGMEDTDFFRSRAEIILTSADPLLRARAISELWAPDLVVSDEEIYRGWQLSEVKANPKPYRPNEIIIQLNSLYEPAGPRAPEGTEPELASDYEAYMKTDPEKIAGYDHPVPIFTRGDAHELIKCLSELDEDIGYEKDCGVFSKDANLKVLISISTTHKDLDVICEKWLNSVVGGLKLTNLDCFLLSENKARELDSNLGNAASIFTVQGKYACHFGALKYAQLIFERAYGIRAGFKLDTDEGIHSRDLKRATGKTWFEHLAHPYWGGSAANSDGKEIKLGFNIGEYVDSRDLDSLGYAAAIRTPEVKPNDDLRGPNLLFNKGAAQAKGTLLFNRAERLEDFISHPLVKGGGYGVDNRTLREAVPMGFSMVGRAEDQQFYYSVINNGVQGIFNPHLRIIHYKASVAASEHRSEVGRTVADIYRMILFRELMGHLDVIDKTRPFPSVYASPLSEVQAFFLWMFLMFKKSAEGYEAAAEEYLAEGLSELIPLLHDVDEGLVIRRFEEERSAWRNFSMAADKMEKNDAGRWTESLRI